MTAALNAVPAAVGACVLAAASLTIAVLASRTAISAPSSSPELPSPDADFTPAEIARQRDYHARLRPMSYLSRTATLVVFAVLGFTPAGAWLLGRVSGGLGWPAAVVVGVAVMVGIGQAVSLPWAARAESVRRVFGLSRRSWRMWWFDAAKGTALALLAVSAAFLSLFGLVRLAPGAWWAPAALAAAVASIVVSFVLPLLVEPLFNRFSPMPAGARRDDLLALAAAAQVPVRDVLVADASRRTAAVNAYVSGLGPSRRVVVWDTLLAADQDRPERPDPVRLVVAHELAHVRGRDVAWGTASGALGAAALVCLVFVATAWPALLRQADVADARDVRVIALMIAIALVATQLLAPVSMWTSRRIEARADLHALDLTGDPGGYARLQRDLAVANIGALTPSWLTLLLLTTHPPAPQRIAAARAWGAAHGVAVPTRLVAP